MPELDKPDSHLTTVKWRFPSVHPEGRKFTLIAGFLALIGLLGAARFLRLAAGRTDDLGRGLLPRSDPTTPADPNLIVAPADGLVTMISAVTAPLELAGEGGCRRIHPRVDFHERVRRPHQPLADRRHVRRIAYVPGKFLNADLDKASEDNERQHFLVEREDGVRIGFTQIAGWSRGGSCRSSRKATGSRPASGSA